MTTASSGAAATRPPPPLPPQSQPDSQPAVPPLPLGLRLFGLMPLFLASAIGRIAGIGAWVFSADYRRKLSDNLRIAGYGPGRVRRQAIMEAGRMLTECPYIWTHKPQEIGRLVRAAETAPIEAAERRGKGVLILTPHLGSFEMAARFYAGRRPITVLYKPPKIEFVRRWLVAARGRDGIRGVTPTVGGLRSMLRTLRRGDVVGLLPDQVPTEGDGHWAPFFGQPAYTMTLPQRLVEMTDCTVVMCVGERLPGGQGWRMHFETMTELPTPQHVNRQFERLIRQLPEQYLWGYNRYKRPPGVQEDRNADLLEPVARARKNRRSGRRASDRTRVARDQESFRPSNPVDDE